MAIDTPVVVPQDDSERRAATLDRVNWMLAAFAIMHILLFGGFVATWVVVHTLDASVHSLQVEIDDAQANYAKNLERGQRNAALLCSNLVAIGQHAPDDCYTSEVLAFWDPSEIKPVVVPG